MDLNAFLFQEGEKPLDKIPADGGFCGIFRTIGCIGDSLSSGEFESLTEQGRIYYDAYPYSWGQFLARMTGSKAYNFSRGGMTAEEYCESFAEANGFWDADKKCECYIIAMGANDVTRHGADLGSVADIDLQDWHNNQKTFMGYYGQIIQRMKEIQPQAKFFLMTMPDGEEQEPRRHAMDVHAQRIYDLAELFENTYVLDFRKYAPVYDDTFKENFYLLGHMNPAGYLLTARMVGAYIDYYVRKFPKDFARVGFIGTQYE